MPYKTIYDTKTGRMKRVYVAVEPTTTVAQPTATPTTPPPVANPTNYVPSEIARHRSQWIDKIAHAPDWSDVPFPSPVSLADVSPTDLSSIYTSFALGAYNAPRVLQTGMPHSEKGWYNMWFSGPRPKSQRAGNIPSQPPNTFAIGTEPTSWYGPGHEMTHIIERGTGINVDQFAEDMQQAVKTNPELKQAIEEYVQSNPNMDPAHDMSWVLTGDEPSQINKTELFAMLPYDILQMQLDKMPASVQKYYSQIFNEFAFSGQFKPPSQAAQLKPTTTNIPGISGP